MTFENYMCYLCSSVSLLKETMERDFFRTKQDKRLLNFGIVVLVLVAKIRRFHMLAFVIRCITDTELFGSQMFIGVNQSDVQICNKDSINVGLFILFIYIHYNNIYIRLV